MSITGEQSGDPMKLGVAIVDLCTGLYASIAILGAIQARNSGLPGQHVEVSLYATSIALLANVASNVLITGKPAGRYGNGHPNIVPYRTFKCRQSDIALAVGNDMQFAVFAAAVGHPEWSSDPRFTRNCDRVENRAVLEGMIEATFGSRSADEWSEVLLAAGVPCSRINTVQQALADPQTAATGMLIDIQHATAGIFRSLGIPMSFSDTPLSVRYPPPALGEHTDSVLTELLGFQADDIKKLRDAAVV
jgi:crotonobetainyl-CoA:carnitine CoA-transferase CaiB-like acyl-CoA transferase